MSCGIWNVNLVSRAFLIPFFIQSIFHTMHFDVFSPSPIFLNNTRAQSSWTPPLLTNCWACPRADMPSITPHYQLQWASCLEVELGACFPSLGWDFVWLEFVQACLSQSQSISCFVYGKSRFLGVTHHLQQLQSFCLDLWTLDRGSKV